MRHWIPLWVALAACAVEEPTDGPAPEVDPTAYGPDGNGVAQGALTLEARTDGFSRTVNTWIVSPRNAYGDPPVVLFFHDENWSPDDYVQLLSHIASYGMMVVAPRFDRTGSTRDDEGLLKDAQLVMRALREAPPEFDALTGDVDVFGVIGHGRGAKQAALVAARDERVAVAMLLGMDDELSASDGLSAIAELGDIPVPVAQVGYGLSIYGEPACVTAGSDYTSVSPGLPAGSYTFELPTAGQLDVLDPCENGGGTVCEDCAPSEDPKVARRFTRAVSTAFLGRYLQGVDGFSTWLEGDGPGKMVPDLVRTRQ